MTDQTARPRTDSSSSPASSAHAARANARWRTRVTICVVALAVLGLLPVLLTEARLLPIHDLVGATIPDVFYLDHAAQGLLMGHAPYAAGFLAAPDGKLQFIYPPLSLLLTFPPLLFGRLYTVGFSLEVLLLVVAGLLLLDHGARRSGLGFPLALIVALFLAAIGPLLVTRVDALQGLLLAGAALALRGRRQALAVALVAIAVLIKETALVAAVPLVAWLIWAGPGRSWAQRLGSALRVLGIGLLAPLVLVVVFLVWSGGGLVGSSLASLSRGIEIESVPATIAALLRPLFPLTTYVGKLGSDQIRGQELGVLAVSVAVAGLVALVWGSVHLARERRRPATALAFAIAISLASTPVLSPQYLLALLPPLAVAAVTEAGPRRRLQLLLGGLLLALLTQVEFPYVFDSVASLGAAGTWLVAVRNLVLVMVAVLLVLPSREPLPAAGEAVAPVPA